MSDFNEREFTLSGVWEGTQSGDSAPRAALLVPFTLTVSQYDIPKDDDLLTFIDRLQSAGLRVTNVKAAVIGPWQRNDEFHPPFMEAMAERGISLSIYFARSRNPLARGDDEEE